MTVKKRDVFDLGVRAEFSPWYRSIRLFIAGTSYDRKVRYVLVDPDFEGWDISEVDWEQLGKTAPLTINLEAAQILMDDLWACGLRPTEGKGSAGALSATERHLEDMRRLVFEGKSRDEDVEA